MGFKRIAFFKSILFSYLTKASILLNGVFFTYLIANYLGPNDYGIVSYYLALIASILNVGGVYFLQGILGVFIPKRKSKYLFLKILKYQFYLGVIFFLCVFIFSDKIALFLNKEEFLFLKYCSFLFLIQPLYDVLVLLFKGFKMFGKVLKVESLTSFVNLFLAFVFVIMFSYGIYGVIYARIISYIVGVLIFVYYSRGLHFRDEIFNLSEVRVYSYSFFLIIIFKGISGFFFTLFVGFFISSAVLGLFYLAQKVANYVLSSFHASISEVMMPYVVEDYTNKSFLNKSISYSLKLSLILSAFSVVLLIIFAKSVLTLFWPSYVQAYYIIVFYSIAASLGSFGVLNTAYMSQNRMDLLARIYFFDLLVTAISSILLMPAYTVYGAIITQILNGLTHIFFSVYYLKRLGLNVDLIVRMDDLKYFLRLIGSLCRRVLSHRLY